MPIILVYEMLTINQDEYLFLFIDEKIEEKLSTLPNTVTLVTESLTVK